MCRRAHHLFALLLLATPAAAYGPDATGADWGKDYYGHPRHQEWLSQYLKEATIAYALVDICLDHITTDENEKVPKRVKAVPLTTLTTWCIGAAQPAIDDPKSIDGKTFRYPDGIVPLSD